MAAPIFVTASQSTVLTGDVDLDGVADPGDVLTTTVTISDTGVTATGVTFTPTVTGATPDGNSLTVTPIRA